MCRICDNVTRYAPLYVHTYYVVAPRKLIEAQLFNQQFRLYKDVPTVGDRLRWCRHHKGLMQKEVAQKLGISKHQYEILELGTRTCLPSELVDKLAAFFEIAPRDLLDDFSLFHYCGQSKMIRAYREAKGYNQKQFAQILGIDVRMLSNWESETKQVSKKSWDKYFQPILTLPDATQQNLNRIDAAGKGDNNEKSA